MKKQLLDKYWKGETSPEEEAWLKQNVPDLQDVSPEEKAYWQTLNQFDNLSMDEAFSMETIEAAGKKPAPAKRFSIFKNFRRLAAAVAVIAVLGVAVNSMMNQKSSIEVVAVEDDPEKAFEIAKQSLMLISAKLNKGIDCTTNLDKFDQVKEKIKSEPILTSIQNN